MTVRVIARDQEIARIQHGDGPDTVDLEQFPPAPPAGWCGDRRGKDGVDLLQHLHGGHPASVLPDLPQDMLGDGMLLTGVAVVSVEKNRGVDEDLLNHADSTSVPP